MVKPKKRLGVRDRMTTLPIVFLAVLFLLYGKAATSGAERGLALCLQTLLPALFPFLVLSELLVSRRPEHLPIGAFSRPVAWLFGISRQGATAVLMGLLCGAPVGTVTAEALHRQGAITDKELRRLILTVNNPSIGFLVGAVGGAMFGNAAVGAVLFAIVWLSALAVGCALRIGFGRVPTLSASATECAPVTPFVGELTSSITRGFSALLRIFAFVIFFSCVSACLSPILAASRISCGGAVLICGMLELTAGVNEAVRVLSPANALRMTAFLAGFSGLSVCLQVFSVTERHRLPILPYLAARTVQGLLSLLLIECYLRLFKPALQLSDCMAAFAQNPVGQMHLSAMLLLLPLLLLTAERKKTQKKRR